MVLAHERHRHAGAPAGVDELIVRSGQGGRDRKFHIPAESEGTETLCPRNAIPNTDPSTNRRIRADRKLAEGQ